MREQLGVLDLGDQPIALERLAGDTVAAGRSPPLIVHGATNEPNGIPDERAFAITVHGQVDVTGPSQAAVRHFVGQPPDGPMSGVR